jgi:hypothetical protein
MEVSSSERERFALIYAREPVLYGSSKPLFHTFVPDERVLEGPEDLTGKTTARIGLYANLCQDSLTSGDRPGTKLLVPLLDLPMTLTDETPTPLRRR